MTADNRVFVRFAVGQLIVRPRVALNTGYRLSEQGGEQAYVSAAYFDALAATGVDAFILPPIVDERRLQRLLKLADALLLTGGPDIDPDVYSRSPHPATKPMHPRRWRFDRLLLELALPRRMPVLAICLGMQTLNVVRGGTLFQHLARRDEVRLQSSKTLRANGDAPPRAAGPPVIDHGSWTDRKRHAVRVVPGSLLDAITHLPELQVVSTHHQGLERLGRGLQVAAVAPDGLVEAIQLGRPGADGAESPFVLALQWHPELQIDEPPHRAIFEAFAAAAERLAASRGRRSSEREP